MLISSNEAARIIFQTKFSRKDKKVKGFSVRVGQICSECGSYVLNLAVHAMGRHGYSSDSQKFASIIENAAECERKEHFRVQSQVNYNPLSTYSTEKSCLNYNLALEVIDEEKHTTHVESDVNHPDCELSNDPYHLAIDTNDIAEILVNPNDCFNMKNIKNLISNNFLMSILDFKEFLSTDWGGSKPEKSINMDISNLIILLNSIGENSFWNPNELNKHLTQEGLFGRAPVTIHSRIRSLRRFIQYLKAFNSEILPQISELDKLVSMMDGVEKTLLRKRTHHQKSIMAANRQNFEHTTAVLMGWREKRLSSNSLEIFDLHREQELLLTCENYKIMRDFLICEIIIPNAQRAGIIPGMILKEIKNAKTQVDDGFHRIMVSEHKTVIYSLLPYFSRYLYSKLSLFSTNLSFLNFPLTCQNTLTFRAVAMFFKHLQERF